MFRWVQAGRFGLVRKIGGEYQVPYESFEKWLQEPYRLIQNDGRDLIMQGTRDWKDYLVEATISQVGVAAVAKGAQVEEGGSVGENAQNQTAHLPRSSAAWS